jgi:hypothetical protein
MGVGDGSSVAGSSQSWMRQAAQLAFVLRHAAAWSNLGSSRAGSGSRLMRRAQYEYENRYSIVGNDEWKTLLLRSIAMLSVRRYFIKSITKRCCPVHVIRSQIDIAFVYLQGYLGTVDRWV